MDVLAQATEHFFAGMALSFVDRYFSDNSRRNTETRKVRKLEQVDALKYLNESTASEEERAKDNKYLESIVKAREYFEERGIVKRVEERNFGEKAGGLLGRVKSGYYKNNERLNDLTLGGKFTAAVGLELAADLLAIPAHVFVHSANFWYAVGRDVVQAPALFAGLATGKGVLTVKDFVLRDKDERYLDSKAGEYARNEQLLETVKKYSPVRIAEKREKTRQGSKTLELPEDEQQPTGLDASRVGNKAGEIASDTVNAVKQGLGGFFGTIKRKAKERNEEREQKDKERYEAIKRKYDKY